MVFRKSYKKFRGKFRSKRSKRKFKNKQRKKYFARMINALAEKKMHYSNMNAVGLWGNVAAGGAINVIANNIVLVGFPNPGVAANERVGTKIFMRYLTFSLNITNEFQNSRVGQFQLLFLIEKYQGSANNVTFLDIYPHNTPNAINYTLLKNAFSKIKAYNFRLGTNGRTVAAVPGGLPQHYTENSSFNAPFCITFKKKFKIMKNIAISAANVDHPGIFFWISYFPAPLSLLQGTGATVDAMVTSSFTDV